MTELKKDPNPGTTPADGTTIATDQWNKLVDRLGGTNSLTATRVTSLDASGNLEATGVTRAQLETLVSGAVDEIVTFDGSDPVVAKLVNANVDATAAIAATKIADGSVDNTEFQYLNGVTSAIQTQLDSKAASSHNHTVADITDIVSLLPSGGDFLIYDAVGSEYQNHQISGDISIGSSGVAAIASGVIVNADVNASAAIAISKLDSNVANVTGDTYTGTHDFGGADDLEIPNSATPTVDTNGQIAIDTSVTDFSHGILKYYSGEEMAVVSMPIAELTTPTNGHVVAYNATNDEFELVASAGGGSSVIPLQVTGVTPEGTVAYPDIHAMGTQGSKISGWVFPDGASEGIVNFKVLLPEAVDTTSDLHIMVIMAPVATIAGTPTVHLEIAGQYNADGEDIDVAFANVSESVNKDIDGTVENSTVHVFDIATNPSSGDRFFNFQLKRDPTDANDDATDDIIVLGVSGWLE